MADPRQELCFGHRGFDQLAIDIFKLRRLAFELGDEKGVFEGNRCLVGDDLNQGQFILGERAAVFLVVDVEHPEQLALADDGAGDEGAGLVMIMCLVKTGVFIDIGNKHGLSLLSDVSGYPFADLDVVGSGQPVIEPS